MVAIVYAVEFFTLRSIFAASLLSTSRRIIPSSSRNLARTRLRGKVAFPIRKLSE